MNLFVEYFNNNILKNAVVTLRYLFSSRGDLESLVKLNSSCMFFTGWMIIEHELLIDFSSKIENLLFRVF